MNNYILIFSAIILYLTCSALLFIYIKKAESQTSKNTGTLSKKHIVSIGFAGLILHSLALYNSTFSSIGVNLGFYNAISLVSAFIVLFTLIATWRHPVEILAIILLPIAAIAMGIESASTSSHLLEAGSSKALVFHILTSIIAYSLLALAALQAILLSVQNRFLHKHQPGGIIKQRL